MERLEQGWGWGLTEEGRKVVALFKEKLSSGEHTLDSIIKVLEEKGVESPYVAYYFGGGFEAFRAAFPDAQPIMKEVNGIQHKFGWNIPE